MRILPKTPAQQVERLTALIPEWALDPHALGLSPARIAELKALLEQAKAAKRAAYEARNAARSATLTFENATAALTRNASSAIASIKATASTAPDPIVVLAQARLPVPVHAMPGSLPAPGKPWGFEVALLQTGAVMLSWECNNPAGSTGTMYEVRRRIGGGGGGAGGGMRFEHLANCGEKTYIDNEIPAGASELMYEVTAFRSTRRGLPARHIVNFGTLGLVSPRARGIAA